MRGRSSRWPAVAGAARTPTNDRPPMAAPRKIPGTVTLRVTLSRQSFELLEALAARGVYGRNAQAVAARFVDRALQQFVDRPKLALSLAGTTKPPRRDEPS